LRRLTLILGAVPVGLATGLLAWLAAGGASADTDRLAPVAEEIAELRAPRRGGDASMAQLADLTGAPLFALTTGPGAVSEPVIRLDGLVVTRHRVAALMAIDGAPPAWLSVGQSQGGVTLQQVSSTKAVIETALGVREIALGATQTGGATSPKCPHRVPHPLMA
jgi:hypothetical protein